MISILWLVAVCYLGFKGLALLTIISAKESATKDVADSMVEACTEIKMLASEQRRKVSMENSELEKRFSRINEMEQQQLQEERETMEKIVKNLDTTPRNLYTVNL